ncbi:MAG: hypothetical protein RIR51_461, partial [Bacteroidota bacterium]
MKKIIQLIIILSFAIGLYSFKNNPKYLPSISAYGLFEGDLKDLKPKENLIPYTLNSPLFSDYAHKERFIYIPKGKQVVYQNERVLDFPVGTLIFKNFFYYSDERKPEKGRRILETRVLKREENEWVAIPYIWDEEQKDAYLDVAGATIPVKFKNEKGKTLSFDYEVPNMNQCKGCHERDGEIVPIGPSSRELNGDFTYSSGKENQLKHLTKLGHLIGLPEDFSKEDHLVSYLDENQSLDDRVRAYLDINCGHCHNPSGPARNSGLFLSWNYFKKDAYGLMKPPVAAGKGSGNLQYDIV